VTALCQQEISSCAPSTFSFKNQEILKGLDLIPNIIYIYK
jgi:hypothetical protein